MKKWNEGRINIDTIENIGYEIYEYYFAKMRNYLFKSYY